MHRYAISIELLLASNVRFKLEHWCELSLNCHICQKRDRTIEIHDNKAMCSSHHAYPARVEFFAPVIEPQQDGASKVTAALALDPEFAVFESGSGDKIDQPDCSWARLHFSLWCPICKSWAQASTQNNETRPREILCAQAHVLALDAKNQPVIKSR